MLSLGGVVRDQKDDPGEKRREEVGEFDDENGKERKLDCDEVVGAKDEVGGSE